MRSRVPLPSTPLSNSRARIVIPHLKPQRQPTLRFPTHTGAAQRGTHPPLQPSATGCGPSPLRHFICSPPPISRDHSPSPRVRASRTARGEAKAPLLGAVVCHGEPCPAGIIWIPTARPNRLRRFAGLTFTPSVPIHIRTQAHNSQHTQHTHPHTPTRS